MLRTFNIRSPDIAAEASLKWPEREYEAALINPGACKKGTSFTVPFIIPKLSSSLTDHVPNETPPYIEIKDIFMANDILLCFKICSSKYNQYYCQILPSLDH